MEKNQRNNINYQSRNQPVLNWQLQQPKTRKLNITRKEKQIRRFNWTNLNSMWIYRVWKTSLWALAEHQQTYSVFQTQLHCKLHPLFLQLNHLPLFQTLNSPVYLSKHSISLSLIPYTQPHQMTYILHSVPFLLQSLFKPRHIIFVVIGGALTINCHTWKHLFLGFFFDFTVK